MRPVMSQVRIDPVGTKRDLKEFLRFPWRVYGRDPNWVPPLLADIKEKLDPSRNPFFAHAERELFLARKDGEVTGRIAAILDRNHNAVHNEKVVFFGFYESREDRETAAALLEAVAGWGRARGMDTLRGPMNPSMNDECAFLVDGFDRPPVIMMPYNPPYYPRLMEECGLTKAKDLLAFYMTRDHEAAAKVKHLADEFRRQTNVRIRKLEKKTVDRDAGKIIEIYNSAWEKNWGFVPWTQEEIRSMIAKLKRIADMRLVLLAEEENGRPVGFAFGLPNYNEVLKRMNGRLTPLTLLKFLYYRRRIQGMRAVVFGISREYRRSGLSYYLYSELETSAIRAGYTWGEMSWLLEDNEPVIKFSLSLGANVYKTYRIYEKKIS